MTMTETSPELRDAPVSTTRPDEQSGRVRIEWRVLVRALAMVVFVATLGMWSYPRLVAPVVAARSQALLENRFVGDAYLGLLPVGDPIVIGQPVALLEIESIDLRRVVVEGTESEQLATGPGHLRGSSLPGQWGVSAIVGRASSFGADFADLDGVEVGDEIVVTTGQGEHAYSVVDVTRRSAVDEAAFTGEGNMLLLVTATGGDSPDGRLVVRAELTSVVHPAGVPVEHSTTTAELGLHGSTRSATALVIWTLVLAVLVILVVPASRRVGARVSWLVFGPTFLVVLLQVFHQLALLLPSAT